MDTETENGRHVLVVDDNPDAADSAAVLLELMGHRVEVAYDGESALEAARQTRFDAVLLDLAMPIMDGFEAADQLRRLQPAPVLVACSAWDDASTRRRAHAAGFSAHFAKPVAGKELHAYLRSLAA